MSHVRSSLMGVAVACACAVPATVAAPASAEGPPPEFNLSTLTCVPENGFTTRPGDAVRCRLNVTLLDGFADEVTVDVALSKGLTYNPADVDNIAGTPAPGVSPPRVHYGTSIFGFFSPAFTKTIHMVLGIAADGTVVPGDPIQPVATISTAALGPVATIPANLLAVTPPPASLTPSTLDCADVNGDALRPGDVLACTLQLRNLPQHEDAEGFLITVPVPAQSTWAPGGNETAHSATQISWGPGALPDGVRAGPATTPALTFRLVVSDVAGGTKLLPYANMSYSNALSHALGSHNVLGAQLTVAPGPAVLTSSTLGCADANGLPLYAGDPVRCTLTVADAAGRESVGDITATAPAPAATAFSDDPGLTVRTFAPAAFGTIAAGDRRSVTYDLRVDPAAAPGTTIAAGASVQARSTETGTPVAATLAAPRLVVSARPAASTPAAVAAAAAAAAVAAAAKPSARGPVICGSTRVVTVNVRPPTGKRWKAVTFAFATKSVKGKKATGARGKKGYYRARLVFKGLPKGPLKVAIKGVTTKGKTVRSSRTYNLCAKKK